MLQVRISSNNDKVRKLTTRDLFNCSTFSYERSPDEAIHTFVSKTSEYSRASRARLGARLQTLKYGDGPDQFMCIVKPENNDGNSQPLYLLRC